MVVNQLGGSTWQCLPGVAVRPGEDDDEAAQRCLREVCGVTGTVVERTAWVRDPFAGGECATYLVDIGDQQPRAIQPGPAGREPEVTAVIWRELGEICERDRAFLWSAGLVAVPVFAGEVASWSSDISYPRRAPGVVRRPELGCGGPVAALDGLTIGPLEEVTARMIMQWHYNPPYDIYSFEDHPETLQELLYGNYYGVTQAGRGIIGYYCYGEAAQVPAGLRVGAYPGDRLDFGLGLRPDLCGQGLGLHFVSTGMRYARQLTAHPLRLTVAAFNLRAIRVYERAGFVRQLTFTRENPGQTPVTFCTMTAPPARA